MKVWTDPSQPLPMVRVTLDDILAQVVKDYENHYNRKVPLGELTAVVRKIDELKAKWGKKSAKRQMGFGFCGVGSR